MTLFEPNKVGGIAWLKAALSSVPDGIIIADEACRIEFFNAAAEEIFGYTEEEVVGSNVAILMPAELDDDRPHFATKYLSSGQPIILSGGSREVVGRRFDGGEFPLDLAISEMSASGHGSYVVVVRDVTQRQQLRDDLVTAKQEAERASQAKSDFLASMSHEIRTPLNAMVGFADLLGREIFGPLSEGQREYLTHIQDAGEMLQGIISGVLDLSSIELGKYEFHPQPVEMVKVLARAMTMATAQSYAFGVESSFDVPERLPPVLADSAALEQIVLNILSNAFKFTAPGGKVRVRLRADPVRGMTLRVSDSGIGMRTADIGRAMEMFAQLDSGFRRRFGGTGIGLPLSRQLVELHGGSLGISSRPGKGTVVTVKLPPGRVAQGVSAQA